jgi:hypothetical protein
MRFLQSSVIKQFYRNYPGVNTKDTRVTENTKAFASPASSFGTRDLREEGYSQI